MPLTMIVDKNDMTEGVVKVIYNTGIYGDYDTTNFSLLNLIYSAIDEGIILTTAEQSTLDKVINTIKNKEPLATKTRTNTPFTLLYYSTLRLEGINLKPIVINREEEEVTNQVDSIIFTLEHFVATNIQKYFDPEGDAVYALKVVTLPERGDLLLSSTPVYKNQTILFSDIVLGLFIYTPDGNSTTSAIAFDYAVSDIGSKTYLK